jgi:serine/threonine protein phosphatase PrpC
MTEVSQTLPDTAAERKPRDDEIDVYGLTHTGKVRKVNQDHFLICSLKRDLIPLSTSLPDVSGLGGSPERLAFLAMVADGVGGGPMGEEASRLAVESITDYVAQCTRCYYAAVTTDEKEFTAALSDAALQSHSTVTERAKADPERRGMATTLTLWIGVWPDVYILQVGDSRCYMLRRGVLTQLSHDQTMAQEMVDQGLLPAAQAAATRWSNVLSSSIGGRQSMPVVTHVRNDWDTTWLLCSDGLTRHVTDGQIQDRLRTMASAREACETLLQDALDGGGSDNVTIIVGRTARKDL